jgi:hypothetical protein
VGDGCRAAARVTGGAADQACVAPAWATARGATVAQTTMGGAAARTCATAAPAMTDGAVARATTGREVTKVYEGGGVAAPDSIADEFFRYDYQTIVASETVEDASPDALQRVFALQSDKCDTPDRTG